MLRSFLFVPGDNPRRLAKAPTIDADAIILDLEDAVVPDRKSIARQNVAQYLQQRKRDDRQSVWVRINPLDHDAAALDLAAIVPAGPDGLMLPKANSAAQVQALADMLDELEHETGQMPGRIGIIPLTTETAAAVFELGSYTPDTPRLRALSWGAEDLGVAIGATRSRDEHNQLLPVFQQAQSMALLAAGAARVPAIETIYSQFTDDDGLRHIAQQARQQGFAGMLAIHPNQVPIINAAFTPTTAEIAAAERIVQAFASADGAGTIALDGRMLDEPHLQQARRLLDAGE